MVRLPDFLDSRNLQAKEQQLPSRRTSMNYRKHVATAALAIALGATPFIATADDAVKTPDRPTGVVIDDAVITAKVKSSLLADSGTKGLKIDVDTKSGVVQLKGNVASDSERTLAQNLAAKVEGVKSVENKLAVK
jgi:hyperosmotically inducible periplasmic protein